MTLLGVIGAAILAWWGLKFFGVTGRAQIGKVARVGGGFAALAVAGLLGLRGRMDMAVVVGSCGAWLLGWAALPAFLGGGASPFGGGSSARSAGSTSKVKSRRIEMVLDHDSGTITGRVLAGAFSGRPLESLSDRELLALRRECLADDPDGSRLIEQYLDGRFPGWREDAEPGPHGGGRPQAQLGTMTQQEAYEILGLQPGASEDAVRQAHRSLMKRLHPDQGGSTWLASRINQAKDLLLGRHA
ncbi:DnaJ domain-containing protein [Enterovirga rhinocerotis]|uniref:DnaJ-like protein n=1 Tax=Enterovirga rhinocerotis TaxID=1339210 RepID=A0A4R7C9G5_9HYPH|nr:DnaJ domain-containing protein [Enterovirga rhinocerotis]TDR93985.1 DnaJ-like protein [Enterovirga rhinocerotis]